LLIVVQHSTEDAVHHGLKQRTFCADHRDVTPSLSIVRDTT
jgi:hypothetical protein